MLRVYSVQYFASYSHTRKFISNEIIKVIDEIGPQKFRAVVSISKYIQVLVNYLIQKSINGFSLENKDQVQETQWIKNIH